MRNDDLQAVRKAKEIRDYLDQWIRVHLLVDSTLAGVEAPDHLMGDPGLCILLNVRMPQRIDITAQGVASAFSFSGQPFDCFFPLETIWAVYQPGGSLDQGLIWPESVPVQVQRSMVAAMDQTPSDDASLSAIAEDSSADDGVSEADAVQEVVSGKRSKGHLRIV
ncbi:MAG: hypothetical protein R8J84_09210 [Mariprofundales bacterium]